jgi:hypothetical protein
VGIRFRKKPVVIEAAQFLRIEEGHAVFDVDDLPEWLEAAVSDASGNPGSIWWVGGEKARVGTSEGAIDASPGDWIIRGIQGELYPCKPDIFEATYEPCRASQERFLMPYDSQVQTDRQRMESYVQRALDDGRGFILQNAAKVVRSKLRQLSAWAASPVDDREPAGLRGVDAWLLSDSAERLEAAAVSLKQKDAA